MLPQVAKITKAERENGLVSTLTLGLDFPDAHPGQFVMVWLPGEEEEKPFLLDNIYHIRICYNIGTYGKGNAILPKQITHSRGTCVDEQQEIEDLICIIVPQ